MEQQKKVSECSGKEDFVTFAIMSVKHSVAHGPKIGEFIKNRTNKAPEGRSATFRDQGLLFFFFNRTRSVGVTAVGPSSTWERWAGNQNMLNV